LQQYNISFLREVDSTNNYLKEILRTQNILAPFAVYAGKQTAGRGQRTKIWESEPFANMLCSFLVSNVGNLSDLAKLNNAAALAVVQALQGLGIKQVHIKWPNDVYAHNHKIAGILIENTFANGLVKNAVVGVGLNVNQLNFDGIEATSVRLLLGKTTEVVEVLHSVYDAFYYFMKQPSSTLLLGINEVLYKKNERVTFATGDRMANYTVQAILANGNLSVSDHGNLKEIEHHITKWIK
jgi:BirA family transcriptional regulator, biotin operon repressor / biotin---[acetyl-CoA-carboxylase] ligase